MRVRIAYTIDVPDHIREAINQHYGKPGLATREEVQAWYRSHGESGDEDLIWDHKEHEEDES